MAVKGIPILNDVIVYGLLLDDHTACSGVFQSLLQLLWLFGFVVIVAVAVAVAVAAAISFETGVQ